MAYQIQLRRDTAANWTSADPTMAQAELGFETDSGKLKIGDGSTAWTSLLYLPVDTDGQLYLLDGKKLYLGTGLDGEIYVSSDDLYVRNVTSNKDIIFSINDGGVQTTVMTVDGTTSSVLLGTTVAQTNYKLVVAGGNLQVSATATAAREIALVKTAGGHAYVGASYDGAGSYGNLVLQTSDTDRLTITTAGVFATGGETAPDASAGGLTLNQGAADTAILTLKSSDVSHGGADSRESDTYGAIQKFDGDGGGVVITALLDGDETTHVALAGVGHSRDDLDTTKSTAGRSAIEFIARQHDGAGAVAPVVADGNVFGIRAYIGAADASVLIVDEDGDIYSVSGAGPTAFDDEDDLALVAAARHLGPGWEGQVMAEHRERLQELGIITGDMYSHRKMTALQLGAITQLVGIVREQQARIDALEKQTA